jgi:hypothetical protein
VPLGKIEEREHSSESVNTHYKKNLFGAQAKAKGLSKRGTAEPVVSIAEEKA